jgi:hypothetical protein
MIFSGKYTLTFIYFILFLFSFITGIHVFITLLFCAVLIISLLEKLGQGIILRESIAFFFVFTCLVMPILGYSVYNEKHPIAFLFNRYMQVQELIYFSYALPALLIFTIVLTFPMGSNQFNDRGQFVFERLVLIREYLQKNKQIGSLILFVGIAELFLSTFIPSGIRFFVDLFFFSAFAAVLMIYFGESRVYKLTLLPGFLFIIFIKSLDSSMFTVIAYMSITMISFFMLGNKTGLLRKTTVFVLGCFFMLLLQNTKMTYRRISRAALNQQEQLNVFVDIAKDQFFKVDKFFQVDEFYQVFIRLNQGYNVSRVMRWIPGRKEFDGGDRLGKVLLSSIIPRFLWSDKLKAGGQENILYYAGWRITGWSTNVGPLGEGYGAFGIRGGIIFMGLLAFYIRMVYKIIWKLSVNYPVIIFWLPVLFYQVIYSAETDTLQVLNSTIKTGFFLWLLSRVKPKWFGIKS